MFLEEFRKISTEEQALFVDLYTNRENDLFGRDKDRFYAGDFLHLSGEGYRVWYDKIIDVIKNSDKQHILK